MRVEQYRGLYRKVSKAGYWCEIQWARSLGPCRKARVFAYEAIWVIISSGMKNQVARKIEEKVYDAINCGQAIKCAFRHKGKAEAIQYIVDNHERLFAEYLAAEDKLAYLESLPWIGGITKYHLAKNLGLDVVKPDRHLVRIAGKEGKTPLDLCKELSELTGDSLAVVDSVLWRAANLGMI